MKTILGLSLVVLIASAGPLWAQNSEKKKRERKSDVAAGNLNDATKRIYKTVGEVELPLYIYKPKGNQSGDKTPAIVFFFGGGWKGGSPAQFVEQCRYLASRGMVAVTVEYRVSSKHDAKVEDCVRDAKSAMRWVRSHAEELGIDPDRIASGGGSAGGHLGACVGVVEGMDDKGDDVSVSAMANAMVLFNPVMALAPHESLPEPYNTKMAGLKIRMGVDPKEISPLQHIKPNQPPLIMFFGTADGLKDGADLFHEEYRKAGNRSEMVTYEGMPHGFFNFTRYEGEYYRKTAREMDRFLASIGYLEGEPTMEE